MKNITILLTVATLTFSAQSHAEGWFDSLKSMLGFSQEAEDETPNTADMVGSIIENLNVDSSQAEGGLGSLFNYVKGNLTADKFNQLSEAMPDINELINEAPDVSNLKSTDGLGSLLDKAAEYSESVKAINDVKKQFEALGLKPEMIMEYIEQAKAYLNTEEGKQTKELLTQGLQDLIK